MANKKSNGHNKPYYLNQRSVTSRHKSARLAKRKKKLEFWISKGVKKNGEKILNLEERKARASSRADIRNTVRDAVRAARREATAAWVARNPGKKFDKRKFKPIKEDE